MSRSSRREVAADVVIISAAIGTIVYRFCAEHVPAATPSPPRVRGDRRHRLLGVRALRHLAAVGSARRTVRGICGSAPRSSRSRAGGQRGGPARHAEIDLPIALSCLYSPAGHAGPRRAEDECEPARRYGRTLITTLSVTTACCGPGLRRDARDRERVGPFQASALISILALGSCCARGEPGPRNARPREVHDALDQKELALRETDKALARLQRRTRRSASRGTARTVFEPRSRDRRARRQGRDRPRERSVLPDDRAPAGMVEGQPCRCWRTRSTPTTLRFVPQTGQGTLRARATHLSRVADFGDPGRVPQRCCSCGTSRRRGSRPDHPVAVQVPAGRTRTVRGSCAGRTPRSRAAKRIARDLHDGPFQGVRCSLSPRQVLSCWRGRPRRRHEVSRRFGASCPKRPTTAAG